MRSDSLAPGEVLLYVFADLAIILLAARVVGGLFVKAGQPRVVGEIVAGLLIGPTVLGGSLGTPPVTELGRPGVAGSGLVGDLYPVQAFSFLSIIGTLAIAFFMFLLGLEVEQRYLRGRGRQIAAVALAVVAVPVALGFVVGAILDEPGTWIARRAGGGEVSATTHALFLGAAFSVTASAVSARILQEKRMLSTPTGAIGVGAAVVVTPLFFLVLAAAIASAEGEGIPETVGVKAVLTLALTVVLFAVVRPLLRRLLARRFDPDRPLDGDLLAILLFGTLASALATEAIGIHAMSGGFLFGAAVPQAPGLGRAVIERTHAFVVLFMIPVFLAVSGIQTNLRALEPEQVGGVVLVLVALVVGKWPVGALAGRAVGLDWRHANAIGVLMNCRGLAILIVALVGRQAGVITEPMQIAFVLGAIATTLMTGPLVSAFLPRGEPEEERKRKIGAALAAVPSPTGAGPRILVVPGKPSLAEEALEAAERCLAAAGPRPRFLFVHIVGPREAGDYVGLAGGVAEEPVVVSRALGWLGPPVRRLAAAGVEADPVVFQSPDPRGDLAKLATEWKATKAFVGRASDAESLEGAGVEVHRLQESLGEVVSPARTAAS